MASLLAGVRQLCLLAKLRLCCAFSAAEPAVERHSDGRDVRLGQSQLALGQRRAHLVLRRTVPRQVPAADVARRPSPRGRGGRVARDGGRSAHGADGARPAGVHRLRAACAGRHQHRAQCAERHRRRHHRRTRSDSHYFRFRFSADSRHC